MTVNDIDRVAEGRVRFIYHGGDLGAARAAVVGDTPLFRLAEVDDGASWFEALARAGILVGAFSGRSRWLRFGISAGEAHGTGWQRPCTPSGACRRPDGIKDG